MNEDGEVKRCVHEGWEIRICLDPANNDGQASGHADLWLEGEHRCRIALSSGRYADMGSACDVLERKARDWVDAWRTRDHAGDADLADL
jgi:hypothetical protein